MDKFSKTPIAWTAIFGAIIGITSFIPVMPYPIGGGVLPLSISFVAIAPLILGFRAGIISAIIGGILGMFINPAGYPYGFMDVFFVAMLPAIFTGLAFKSDNPKIRYIYAGIIILSGLFAEIVPYYYPGSAGNFQVPPQPLYFLLVSFFVLPWLILYISPVGTKYIGEYIRRDNRKDNSIAAFIGILIGLMPWCLWMIAPVAFVLKLSPELSIANWIGAAISRTVFSFISAIILAMLIELLNRSGMPIPAGAVWVPKGQENENPK